MEAKTFPIEVLISAESNMLLCKFSEMHEYIEHVLGRPICTHEMAHAETCEEIQNATWDVCPSLALTYHGTGNRTSAFDFRWRREFSAITPENYREVLDWFLAAHAEIPRTVSVPRGNSERTKHPVDTLREMVPDAKIVQVEVK